MGLDGARFLLADGTSGSGLSPALAAAALLAAVLVLPVAAAIGIRALGRRLYPGDAVLGILRGLAIPYVRIFHRLRADGLGLVPRRVGPEGLIVVSNHVAGLDPVALQAMVPFPIRWMMSAEMMVPALGWLWRRLRIIPVTFDSRDASALKAAIAHVHSGGALGIFPEGAIERPPRQLRPFSGGLRLILARTRAPVLVAAIDPGRPAEGAYAALLRPTRARLRFLALLAPGPDGHPRDVAERIYELLRRETGWPVNAEELAPADRETVERNLRAYVDGG